jgi:LemA protein
MNAILIVSAAIVLAIVVVAFATGAHDRLIQARNNVEKAWANLDVHLQQRHDELLRLVDAVQGHLQHERDLLERLTRLRVGYDQAGEIDDRVRIENEINRDLGRLRHVCEGDPYLRASQSVAQLQFRISGVERSFADRRESFNDRVNVYNSRVERFPDSLVAGALKLGRRALLAVPEELERDVVVDLSA